MLRRPHHASPQTRYHHGASSTPAWQWWFGLVALGLMMLTAACGSRSGFLDEYGGFGGTGGQGGTPTTTATTATTTTTTTTGTGGSGGQGGADNPIISERPGSLFEAEVSVAVGGNGYVAVAWIGVNQNGGSFIGYTLSTDQGLSFTPPAIAQSPNGGISADPVVAVDDSDNFYLTWVGYYYGPSEPYDMHVYVARADAGTTSFAPAVEATDPNLGWSYDKPWIATTNQGTVLVTYMQDDANDVALVAARSSDGGQSFTRSTIASVWGNLAYVCTPRNGDRVWATYLQFGNFGVRPILRWSDDDGASWPANNRTVVSQAPDVAFVDPNCAAEQDTVWISFGLSHDPPGVDFSSKTHAIRVAHSADGGQSIDATSDALDTDAAPLSLLPQLALADNGDVHVVYYSGQHDDDSHGAFRRARAAAAPATLSFEPSVVVHQPMRFLSARADPEWLGDYTDLQVRDGYLYAAFAVNGTGYSHVAFHRTAVP